MNGHRRGLITLGGAVLTAVLAACAGQVSPAAPSAPQPERLSMPTELQMYGPATPSRGQANLAAALAQLFPDVHGTELQGSFVGHTGTNPALYAAVREGTTPLIGDPIALADKALHALKGAGTMSFTFGAPRTVTAPDAHTVVRCAVTQAVMPSGSGPGPSVCAWADGWSVGVLVDFMDWNEQQSDQSLIDATAVRIDHLLIAARGQS